MRRRDPTALKDPSGIGRRPDRSEAQARTGRLLRFEPPQRAEPTSPPEHSGGRSIWAAIAGALALLSGMLFSLLPRPPIDSAELLRRLFPPSTPQPAWLPNALLHAPFRATGAKPERERAFRLGVDLFDLHLELVRNAQGAAAATAGEMAGLTSPPWVTLYRRGAIGFGGSDAESAPTLTEITAAEHAQAGGHHVAVSFGRWCEAARLAAWRGSTAFFSYPDTLPTLRSFLDQENASLDQRTAREVSALSRRLEGGPLTPTELPLLLSQLEQIVAKNGDLEP
jgi:hypothetical protein